MAEHKWRFERKGCKILNSKNSRKIADVNNVYLDEDGLCRRGELLAHSPETAAERNTLRQQRDELLTAATALLDWLEKSVNAGPISNKPRDEAFLLTALRVAVDRAHGEQQ